MGPISAPASEGVDKGRGSAAPENASSQIRAALEAMVLSAPFRNSQQAQKLLRYIVEHSEAHEDHLLRERVIGSEVFGRPPDYDTGGDPVVRIRVSEVRKRLAQYYQSHAPGTQDLTIEIPSGSYRAVFRWRELPEEPPAALAPADRHPELAVPTVPVSFGDVPVLPAEVPSQPPASFQAAPALRSRRWLVIGLILAVCVVGALVAAGSLWRQKASTEAWRQFWNPWLSSPKPVLIAIGSNAVYRFTNEITDPYQHAHHLEAQGDEFFLPLSPESTVPARDLVASPNSFVALGDVAAASAVVANLSAQHHPFQERFPNDISFVELRNSPSILVGGFNNPMTVELTKRLPFVMRKRNEIDDTVHGRKWVLDAPMDSHDTEDYAIVTRLVQEGGDAPVLAIAGIGEYGTLAAANFVANPTSVTALAHKLPANWADHNLQAILHLRVIDFKPSSVEVIATQTW